MVRLLTRRLAAGVAGGLLVAALLGGCGGDGVDSAGEVAVSYLQAVEVGDFGRRWDLSTEEARRGLPRDQFIAYWLDRDPGIASEPPVAFRLRHAQSAGSTAKVVVEYRFRDGRSVEELVYLRRVEEAWRVERTDTGPLVEELEPPW